MDKKHIELLELIPAYHRGELSPTQANRVSEALRTDERFSEEATRERLVVDTLMNLESMPLPKKLVTRAVKNAAGEFITEGKWFSLDTILVALGVGVFFGYLSQLLASQLTLPNIGNILIGIADIVADSSSVFIVAFLLIISFLIVGGFWLLYRVFGE